MASAIVVFDAYGTLFDVHSVVGRCDALFPGHGETLSRLWRSKQLEYTWLRSLMQRYEDFERVTFAALRYACRTLSLALDDHAANALLEAYRHLNPYSEVQSTLQALDGRRLAVLSNGSLPMLTDLVRNAGFESMFDAVLSVDARRTYKPHPSIYQLAVDQLRAKVEDIAFVSSNYWDVSGATSFGLQTFWINRSGAQPDELGYQPYRTLERLDQLPDAISSD